MSSVASSCSTSRAQRGVAAAPLVEDTWRARPIDVGQREEDRFGVRQRHLTARQRRPPERGRARGYSHARANAHSFFTVAGDKSIAAGGFLHAQPGEIAQRDDPGLARIASVPAVSAPRRRRPDRSGRDPRAASPLSSSTRSGAAAMLDALIAAGALDQDAAHRERRGGEEMTATIPAPCVRRRDTRR